MQVLKPMISDNQDCSATDKQQLLQQNILNSLSYAPGDSTAQCRRLQQFLTGTKKEACRIILYNLVQLNFSKDEACTYWTAIINHAEKMQTSLGRKIGLATAACDYFSTIRPYLNNPKLIEFTRFEETLKSAHQDFLTGLLTRTAFQSSFDQEISRATRHNHNISMIFFDLDKFKNINDTYGHLAGDEVLKEVGKVLLDSKRKEDIACRFGGDEFVILLPETNKFMGLLVGKKLLDQINSLIVCHKDEKISVSCCGGLASFPQDSRDGQDLMSYADQALYQAKNRGKHELNLFSEEKRTFTRIDFEHSVTAQSFESETHAWKSNSKNISEGGILVTCNNTYNIGTRLELQIALNKGSQLTITGSVVRVEQFDTGSYDIGLSFLQVESPDDTPSQAIAEYILQKLAP